MSPRPQGAMTLCLIVCKAPFSYTALVHSTYKLSTHTVLYKFSCATVSRIAGCTRQHSVGLVQNAT